MGDLVELIGKKVQEKKGESILFVRDFLITGETTGDFSHPSTEEMKYYEGGNIQGPLLNQQDYLRLPSPALFFHSDDYSLTTDCSIPVDRKIYGFLGLDNGFHFNIKELEKIGEGNILFSSYFELPYYINPSGPFSENHKANPRLQKFSILVGDEEVKEFLEVNKIKNSNEFFKILKNPEDVRKRIEAFHYDERKSFGKSLLVNVSDISQCFSGIKSLEESVLGADYLVGRYQNEGYAYWDRKSVGDYNSFRRDILEKIGDLNQQLKEGDQLYAKTKSPLIDGRIIGFPRKISFSEYSQWIKEVLLPEINQKIERIDTYLNSKEKK